eukprot:764370-Hanusia_phi.AAC.1
MERHNGAEEGEGGGAAGREEEEDRGGYREGEALSALAGEVEQPGSQWAGGGGSSDESQGLQRLWVPESDEDRDAAGGGAGSSAVGAERCWKREGRGW